MKEMPSTATEPPKSLRSPVTVTEPEPLGRDVAVVVGVVLSWTAPGRARTAVA
ncbi:hypothetical protein ACFFX0_02540 [Citricoccus parietis]|uniref:Uncharacterized protein n=1 Tax=Citricoccus parietis TaxID=592307 RepID=A0ABV5FUK3_9MICC